MKKENRVSEPEYMQQVVTGDILMDGFIHMTALGDIVHRDFDDKLDEMGLTRAKFSILFLLRLQFDSITPTALSKRMPRAKHTISRAITELEKDGLVKRQVNLNNYRSLLITLTEKGKKYADRAIDSIRQMSHEVMACLGEQQLREFDKALKIVRDYLLEKV